MNRQSVWTLMLVIMIYASSVAFAQEPPKPAGLGIESYCTITTAMWQRNVDGLQRKIALIDSLYQMPEQFLAAEQALNDSIQVWQDSLLAEYGVTIEDHLAFGKEHKKAIEKYLTESGIQQQLDSLAQVQDERYAVFRERRIAYNIDSP